MERNYDPIWSNGSLLAVAVTGVLWLGGCLDNSGSQSYVEEPRSSVACNPSDNYTGRQLLEVLRNPRIDYQTKRDVLEANNRRY